MPVPSIYTNCGEYLPGQKPIDGRIIVPPVINVIIPDRNRDVIVIKPIDPFQPKYKCVRINGGDCPPIIQPNGEVIVNPSFIQFGCKPCDGGAGNPGIGEAGCDSDSLEACIESGNNGNECKRYDFPCENPRPAYALDNRKPPSPRDSIIERRGGGRRYSGPQDTVPPAATTGGPPRRRPPGPTTLGETRYKCNTRNYDCPPPKVGIVQIKQCVACTELRESETGNLFWPPGCIHKTKSACETICAPPRTDACTDRPAVTVTNTNSVSQSSNQNNNNNNNITVRLSNLNQQITSNQKSTVINIQKELQTNINVFPKEINSENSIYSTKRNFFQPNEVQKNRPSYFVQNFYRRDIFKEGVVEEIAYITQRYNTNHPWSETILQTLTPEKIAVSINENLLEAFNNIHDISGKRVDSSLFLETLKKLILTNSLDEFDPNYYISIAQKQSNDQFKVYNTPAKNLLENYALGISEKNKINPLSYSINEVSRNFLNRQKKLNEDVRTRTYYSDGVSSSQSLGIFNGGIYLFPSGSDGTFAENGIGAGYYLPVKTIDNRYIPLEYDIDYLSYIPPPTRYEAISLLNEDPKFYITARSASNVTEFTSGINFSYSLEPMYLKLNLSSVSSSPTNTNIVKQFKAKYELMTDQSLINDHTNTNGFAVTKVNIDYRDPILKYISDTSSFEYQQNDISFNDFNGNKTILLNNISEKNLPFGIIITPVKGSRFNPFSGRSIIDEFDQTYVSRKITLTSPIHLSDGEDLVNPLKIEKLSDLGSDFKIGLIEQKNPYGLTLKYDPSATWIKSSFYSHKNGSYNNTVSPVSSYGASFMIKEVIDKLKVVYNVSGLYWYDIFRRMPMERMGELMYDCTPSLLNSITNGFRNDIKVKDILKKSSESFYDNLPDDQFCIIKNIDRNAIPPRYY